MKKLSAFFLFALVFVFIFPLFLLVINSLDTFGDGLKVLPRQLSLNPLFGVLFHDWQYARLYVNSLMLTTVIMLSHLLMAVITGYALAQWKGWLGNLVALFYIAVMLLPLQVTVLPNFILSRALGLYDTWWSIVLPAIFAPLGSVLVRQSVLTIPSNIKESAMMDTNRPFTILFRIILPMISPMVIMLGIIVFAECWNMVEQPLVMLMDVTKHPLSVQLSKLPNLSFAETFAQCLLFIVPVILLLFAFSDDIIQGIGGINGVINT